MAAREENILNVPISETLKGMHVLCDTGDTGEPYRVAASLFIAEATQAAKDAVSNLDPKDVILKGFTALTEGKPAITANSTLLAAIQSLYAMVGSGKVKIVSDGADQTGMVCWNGTSASGFVINVNEAAIYTRSQWTQSNPDSVTDANWIAAVKTGGTKTPFAAAAQNPNMGDLPTNSSLKFVDNKTTILGMLKMLTAATNVGRLRIVSGHPATGASGKPELAFIINIVQGANAETQGTNGLQIFHLTNAYIRVIPSSSIAMAWPTLQTLTDEAIITKLHSTASGDWGGLGVMMEWAGGGGSAMKYLTVTDFKSNTFSNGAMGNIAVGEMFTFTSAVDAANGPGLALVGYAVKTSALSIKYVGTNTSINTYRRSYLYTYQSTSIYATNWSILGTPTGIEASVYEFTYRAGADNVPTDDLKLVKVADIFRLVFSTPDRADYRQLDFIRSQDNDKADQYVFVCPTVNTGATLGGTLQRIAVDPTTGAVDLTGSSGETFPGWKQIVSSWSCAVGPSGVGGVIKFNQEIPITSKILIEATIQSSPATTATIKFPIPLTVAAINGTGQGILFEICSIYLGINSTPGSIKLICSSVVTGANGVQGMNVVVQSNNLSDVSDIIQIKGIYFKA
jgi:hypothetical protein